MAAFKGRVPRRLVVQFARNLSIMLRTGVPIVASLNGLTLQPECPAFGEMIGQVVHSIEGGQRLSKALSQFPQVFPAVYIMMVTIGEQTGGLDCSLDRLAGWLESDEDLVQSVKAALIYPIFVLTVSAILTFTVFYLVLPRFVGIFESMHIPLPALTRLILGLTVLVRKPLFWLMLAGSSYGVVQMLVRELATLEGRARLFRLALRVPLLATILWEGSSARYCSAAAALLAAGTDLSTTFRLAAGASGNPLLVEDVGYLVKSIKNGEQVSTHMNERPEIYSRLLVFLMRTGEETYKMPRMLDQAAFFHGMETRCAMDALKSALEPLMLAGVAGVVTTIVMAVFLPMYSFLDQL